MEGSSDAMPLVRSKIDDKRVGNRVFIIPGI
jgi:hypothetical protein